MVWNVFKWRKILSLCNFTWLYVALSRNTFDWRCSSDPSANTDQSKLPVLNKLGGRSESLRVLVLTNCNFSNEMHPSFLFQTSKAFWATSLKGRREKWTVLVKEFSPLPNSPGDRRRYCYFLLAAIPFTNSSVLFMPHGGLSCVSAELLTLCNSTQARKILYGSAHSWFASQKVPKSSRYT